MQLSYCLRSGSIRQTPEPGGRNRLLENSPHLYEVAVHSFNRAANTVKEAMGLSPCGDAFSQIDLKSQIFPAVPSTPMRAGLGIDTLLGQPEPGDRTTGDEMFGDDFGGVGGLDVAVPDGVGVYHNGWAMFALVQAEGFVDADCRGQAGGFGELLELGEKLALSITCAGWARSVGGTDIMTDKDMAFKCGQKRNPPEIRVIDERDSGLASLQVSEPASGLRWSHAPGRKKATNMRLILAEKGQKSGVFAWKWGLNSWLYLTISQYAEITTCLFCVCYG
jgi:hypothetical protein